MGLLARIENPEDLKKVEIKELPVIAAEIRDLIIRTVAANGGHLGASLGAVELAIAIHYVFDTPHDAVIWDVGHQAYAHKILTGRRELFSTLRRWGGISGFPHKDEGPYDPFITGHGSTSISYGLGMACAHALKHTNNKVIVCIGDGSLTGGMAQEALNHAGHVKKNLIIILNDNALSIAPSVGGWRNYLTRTITNPFYNKIHRELELFIKGVPMVGPKVLTAAKKIEEGLKHLLTPGMVFEELGIRYFGTIDGHNIPLIITTLKNVKDMEGPILIHAITKKGKGYVIAENLPEKFHGINPFDIETGEEEVKKSKGQKTYTQIFGETLVECARNDTRIVAITAAMPQGTGLDLFEARFPDRFFNVGMAEEHAVGFAAGLARMGLIPVVAIYSSFLQRSYDQIIHDVCLQGLPVIFAIDRAGLVGEDGPTHHGVFDIAYLRHIPGLVFMAPRDAEECKKMITYAVQLGKPVAIRYPRAEAVSCLKDAICPLCENRVSTVHDMKEGKWEMIEEGRSPVAILACGSMVNEAYQACQVLANQYDISPFLINARWIKPLDHEMLDALLLEKQISSLITLEEGVQSGGFGSAVLEYCAECHPTSSVQVHVMGLGDQFIEHGRRADLLKKYKLDSEAIVKKIHTICQNRAPSKDFFHGKEIVRTKDFV